MIQTKYFCDRCKVEVKKDNLHRIQLIIRVPGMHGPYNCPTDLEADWCRECMCHFNYKWTPSPDKPVEQNKTIGERLEELFTEMLNDRS